MHRRQLWHRLNHINSEWLSHLMETDDTNKRAGLGVCCDSFIWSASQKKMSITLLVTLLWQRTNCLLCISEFILLKQTLCPLWNTQIHHTHTQKKPCSAPLELTLQNSFSRIMLAVIPPHIPKSFEVTGSFSGVTAHANLQPFTGLHQSTRWSAGIKCETT